MMEISLERIRDLCEKRKIKWSIHAVVRYQERGITRKEIIECIRYGDIIEEYPTDYPNPSCLMFHCMDSNKPLHVVVGYNENTLFVITAYRPDFDIWKGGFRERKER
ncbi:MAG: DUF4258 domain-containing protein [Bacillota bacterium]|nr:DUF4258 domain-containing protein [Bacillota bacterium]